MVWIEGRFPDGRKQVFVNEFGMIKNVRTPKKSRIADVVFSDDLLVLPAFVDVHVHARDDPSHKLLYKEDYRSCCLAAKNGGVGAFMAMPNDPLLPHTLDSYKKHIVLINRSKHALIDVVKYAAVVPNGQAFDVNVPYKCFMDQSFGGVGIGTVKDLQDTLEFYQNCHVAFHCESPSVLGQHKDEVLHAKKRPAEAEHRAIYELMFFLKSNRNWNIKPTIAHVSTKKGLESILRARDNGLDVRVEVTPHHLFFYYNDDGKMCYELNNQEMIIDDQRIKMNPPIRSKEDRDFLLDHLEDINFLATDHAPHCKDSSDKLSDFSGVPHLDTYGVFVCWLLNEKNVSEHKVYDLCCKNPGNFFNRFSRGPKYGSLQTNYVGSFVVLDKNSSYRIKKSDLKTKCNWSPFENISLPGKVKNVFLRGMMF